MKKIIALALALIMVLTLTGTTVFAADQNPNASAKATAQIAELHVISEAQTISDTNIDWETDVDWSAATKILEQTIKTPNMKDLFIDASLLSALYTETNVKSSGGTKDTSAAVAAVLLKVQVDNTVAFPGTIIFNARAQVLSATLQGIINASHVVVAPEEIGLILWTLSANSFNFIVPDLEPGMHTVKVWARCVTFAASQTGSAKARAVIGLGSVTIEQVRMVKGENTIIELQ